MFSIAPIGSCRIATPLRLNRDIYGYRLSHSRNYGFCHSSSEAVQQLKFINGDFDVAADIWPLIARGKDRDVTSRQRPGRIDLCVVELSSAKVVTVDETCVQINYLRNEFFDFFSDIERVRQFWSLSRLSDQATTDAFLKRCWSNTPDQMQDCEILRRVRMKIIDEDSLLHDVQWIIANTPDVFFVTHVNALKPDQQPIASRSNLIDMVTRVVTEQGARVYNPTKRMHEMGQESAIEDHSDSLAHFTPEFCYRFFPDWYDLAIQPSIDARIHEEGVTSIKSILLPNVEALLENGKTTKQSERLDALASYLDDVPQLSLLQARVDMADDKVDQACKRLTKAGKIDTENPGVLRDLASAAFDNRDGSLALTCFQKLHALAEPISSDDLFSMGQAFAAEGQKAIALDYLELAVKVGPVTRGLAHSYVDLVAEVDDRRMAQKTPEELTRVLATLETGHRVDVEMLCGARCVDDLSCDLIKNLCQLWPWQLVALLDQRKDQVGWQMRMEIVRIWREQQDPPNLAVNELRALVDCCFQSSYDPNLGIDVQVDVLQAVLGAFPLHKGARIAQRYLRKAVITQARVAFKSEDPATLTALAEATSALAEPLTDLALYRARLALADGQMTQALTLAREAVNAARQNPVAWITLLRAAFKAQDFFTLDEACREFFSLEGELNPSMILEAQTRQRRLPAMAFKAARDEQDPFVAHRLLGLAASSPELVEAAAKRRARIELNLAKDLRELAKSDVDLNSFLLRARSVIAVVGNGDSAEMALIATGRALVRQRDFKAALEFWEKAVNIDPHNEKHLFQRDRCIDRIGRTSDAAKSTSTLKTAES